MTQVELRTCPHLLPTLDCLEEEDGGVLGNEKLLSAQVWRDIAKLPDPFLEVRGGDLEFGSFLVEGGLISNTRKGPGRCPGLKKPTNTHPHE